MCLKKQLREASKKAKEAYLEQLRVSLSAWRLVKHGELAKKHVESLERKIKLVESEL